MAIRATTALVNKLAAGYGIRELLKDLQIYVYNGGQPASGDDVSTGNNLVTFTEGGLAYTGPTKAIGTVTLTGVAGQVDSIKMGGMAENLMSSAEVFATDLTALAVLVAANINAKQNLMNIIATSALGVVSLYAPFWLGANADGLDVASAGSGGITATPADFAGGVTALNGINFDFPAVDGKISMPAGADWKGTGAIAGTAGWFRAVSGGSLVNGLGADEIRFDGTLASSGGDLEMGSLTVAVGAIQTVASLSITQPKAKT